MEALIGMLVLGVVAVVTIVNESTKTKPKKQKTPTVVKKPLTTKQKKNVKDLAAAAIAANKLALVMYRQKKKEYIKDAPEWKALRLEVLKRDSFMCRDCGTSDNLNVHHLSYKNLYNEPLHDLITVCKECHFKRHEQAGWPRSLEAYHAFTDTKVPAFTPTPHIKFKKRSV